MKTLLMLAIATLIAAPAFAKPAKLYTIDMTGKRFGDDGFNLMGDDTMGGDYEGIQIKLDGTIDEDFELTVSASNPADAKDCKIGRVKTSRNFTFVELIGSPETDTGDTCDYTIVYTNGAKAVMRVESTGT